MFFVVNRFFKLPPTSKCRRRGDDRRHVCSAQCYVGLLFFTCCLLLAAQILKKMLDIKKELTPEDVQPIIDQLKTLLSGQPYDELYNIMDHIRNTLKKDMLLR